MSVKISELLTTRFNEAQTVRDKPVSDEFVFTLKRLGDEGLAERLNTLIVDITAQGKKLNDHMDIGDLRHYRSLVGDFINEVVTHSHEFSRENFLDRRGRHRVYGIVRRVNGDLDDLAQELLKTEKDHLAILEKTSDIEGLLLDLLV
jgi:uncharacterized protein YaaR (DUF327 family)